MIHELDTTDYHRVRRLFGPLAQVPFCAAVLEGSHPGRVFVDDLNEPRTAFLVTREVWGYVAGDPENDAFNQALNRALFARKAVDKGAPLLQLACHPEGWRARVQAVCHPREPVEERRRYYVCRTPTVGWRPRVPEGVEIHSIDATLLERPGVALPDDVRALVEGRGSSTDPLGRGFGYLALHGDAVASYALVDCIAADGGDIFLFTAEPYRRRGLAALTAAATLEYGLSHGLSRITWDCATQNVASARTAEKIGCTLEREYSLYYFLFDEQGHLLNLAWNHLEAARYREAVALCQQLFALGEDLPVMAFVLAARAWAGAGDREQALEYLRTAATRGWDRLDVTRRATEFELLHATPAWAAVLQQIRQNKRQQGWQ
jgi:GNAT superfamily N-acetyltransferase